MRDEEKIMAQLNDLSLRIDGIEDGIEDLGNDNKGVNKKEVNNKAINNNIKDSNNNKNAANEKTKERTKTRSKKIASMKRQLDEEENEWKEEALLAADSSDTSPSPSPSDNNNNKLQGLLEREIEKRRRLQRHVMEMSRQLFNLSISVFELNMTVGVLANQSKN